MNLPVYELTIDEKDPETGVSFIALVDAPAIEKSWKAFNKSQHAFKANKEQHVISGPAMVANQLIYRKDEQLGEYNVMFTGETIKKIVERYFRDQKTSNFNMMHNSKFLAEGVFMFESMIIDSKRGISTPKGFETLPDGSWFISCKVENETIWDDFIKTGDFTGFSVEGVFSQKKVSRRNKVLDEIMDILSQVKE